MVEKEVLFLDKADNLIDSGRIAAGLIQKASEFVSDVRLEVAGRRANAKSLLGVMSLALDKGTEIKITAEGPDEDEALEALSEYLLNPVLD